MEKIFLTLTSCSSLLYSRLASRIVILVVPHPFIVDVGQDHLQDMMGVNRFQPMWYDLRIVVEMAQKIPSFRAYLEAIGSLIMPESGLRAHLDHLWEMEVCCRFSTNIVQFTNCGGNGPENQL